MAKRQKSVDDLLRQLQAEVKRLGTQRAVARAIGVNEAVLARVLRGNQTMGKRIPTYFGLRPQVVYVPAESSTPA